MDPPMGAVGESGRIVKTAKEWQEWGAEHVARRMMADGASFDSKAWGDTFIHAVQADALEAAAEECERHRCAACSASETCAFYVRKLKEQP